MRRGDEEDGGRGYTLAERRGGWGWGSIFWKTQDIGLASYSNNLSTVRINCSCSLAPARPPKGTSAVNECILRGDMGSLGY